MRCFLLISSDCVKSNFRHFGQYGKTIATALIEKHFVLSQIVSDIKHRILSDKLAFLL